MKSYSNFKNGIWFNSWKLCDFHIIFLFFCWKNGENLSIWICWALFIFSVSSDKINGKLLVPLHFGFKKKKIVKFKTNNNSSYVLFKGNVTEEHCACSKSSNSMSYIICLVSCSMFQFINKTFFWTFSSKLKLNSSFLTNHVIIDQVCCSAYRFVW